VPIIYRAIIPLPLKSSRDLAVVKAAAERAGWEPRPSPRPNRAGDTLTGRGIAYAQRSGAVVAIVAEVEIDRRTGKVWAHKFTVAHDCGLINSFISAPALGAGLMSPSAML
jgi:nicotinate dehydrogenase subunit B